jgi:hypothetical protein
VAATNGNLRRRVAAAAAALLGAVPAAQAAKPSTFSPVEPFDIGRISPDQWIWDVSYMHYKESERITVSEPQIGVRRVMTEGRVLSVLATVDTISGATPLGTLPLTPNTAPNTVTSASGRSGNPDIGKVPTTDMSDTRLALNTTYENPLGPSSRQIVGANVSKEHDFLSLGASYTWNRDFNQKNTTLALGLSPEFDIVEPNGGLPLAYGVRGAADEFERKSKQKYLVGGLIGLTQVISRRTLMQWNYSPTYENGYLSDPYKLFSITNTTGDPLTALHEKRPGSRLGQSFYWLTRYALREEDAFSLGLRYYADNWGIHSQTIDFTYRWQYHERRFAEPHVRYYHQSAANFFRAGLLNTDGLPDAVSADYRLNAIDGVTFGLRFGWALQNGSELILRAEYYTQTGDRYPKTAAGLQRRYNLFPTLHATILQFDYTFQPRLLFSKKKSK